MTTSGSRAFEPRLATVQLDLTPIRGKRILDVDDDVSVRRASDRLLHSASARAEPLLPACAALRSVEIGARVRSR